MDHQIFIVEADEYVKQSIEVLFVSLGYSAQSFTSLAQIEYHCDRRVPACLFVGVTQGASLEELERFASEHPSVRIVLMTDGCSLSEAVHAMRIGMSDVLELPLSYSQIQASIARALEESCTALNLNCSRLPEDIASLLTRQEEEIVRHLINGASMKEIASKLDLSIRTIHYRKNEIFHKIGATSKDHAVRILTNKCQSLEAKLELR